MKVMEIKIIHRGGTACYTPIRGFALFKHCAGNNESVSEYYFFNHVKPLLLAHGVEEVNIV